MQRFKPTLIEELKNTKIIAVSCGAKHTIFTS